MEELVFNRCIGNRHYKLLLLQDKHLTVYRVYWDAQYLGLMYPVKVEGAAVSWRSCDRQLKAISGELGYFIQSAWDGCSG